MLDVKFDIEVSKHLVIELPAIISDNGVEKSESSDDWFVEEVLDLALGHVC